MKIVLALIPVLLILTSGCTTDTGSYIQEPEQGLQDSLDFLFDVVFGPPPESPGGVIRVATWNIENFGKTKARDPTRIEKIASVLSQYDIIAVQEVSNLRETSDPGCSRNDDACPGSSMCDLIRNALDRELNQKLGLNYSFSFSPQVKDERYLFVYNQEKVVLLETELMEDPEESQSPCSLDPDGAGLMNRQPYLGVFRADDFDFILLTAHTSPGLNLRELDGLDYFYRQALERGEPDVILLGDINADCSYLAEDEAIGLRDPDFIWPVGNDADTTVGSSDCAYDRFIFTQPTLRDSSGSWGIDMSIPSNVSDHYPVWLEFYTNRDRD